MNRIHEEERPTRPLYNIGVIMFTSLMILLLTFFIMLSSIAVIDERRQKKALGSVLGAFGHLPGGLSPARSETKSIAPPTGFLTPIQADVESIRDVLSNRLVSEHFHLLRGRTRRIISLKEAVLFPKDGLEILPEIKPLLLEICRILEASVYPIVIEGHTDDQPPQTEGLIDNWHVSTARALNVIRFFIEKGRLDPSRLSAYGYADNKPAVANTSPQSRARNRRIDLILDAGHQRGIKKYKERHRPIRSFDFKGFTFRLFGEEKR